MITLNIITLLKPYGGAQAVALDHIRYQLQENHKSILITSNENNSFIDFIDHKNFTLIILKPLNSSNPLKLAYAFIWIFLYVIKHKPNCIVSHSTIAGVFSRIIAKINTTKSIHTYHGFNTAYKRIFGKIYLLTEKFMRWFNDTTINVCETDYNYAIQNNLILEKKAHVVYNSTSFKISDTPKTPENEEIKFVMVARHCSQKDHTTLFKAIQKVQNKNFKVDLIGAGELLEEHKKLAKDMGLSKNIRFLGEVDNVSERLKSYDCSLLISNMEGFSISILESLASALPVIASDAGGVKEQVIDNYNGYLIPIKDHDYLAQKLFYIIGNPKQLHLFSRNGIKLVNEKFSIVSFNKNIHSLYENNK
jgi:glycosyltransferase involved in cell wall biosynthesis